MNGPSPWNLEPAQALFQSFFEFSPDAIVATDGNGRITNVNSQVERVFGYTRAELLGLPVETLMPERFRAAHPGHRRGYSAHPSVRAMGSGPELYGRRKDGVEFPVDIMLSPVETPGGLIFLSVIRDLSEKKHAEEALRQSEQELRKSKEHMERELRQLIDAIPQQVFVFDSDWTPLFANRRELEYTGLTSQGAQSKDAVARIFHPEDLKKLEVMREHMRSEGVPSEMEARIRGKDGEYRWFLIRDNPLRDEQGRVLRWYGTRTDIEDRKRAEEKLRLSELDLRQLIDAIPQQVFVFDSDWSPLFANRRELEYTGLTSQEAQSKDAVARIFHPEDLKKLEVMREHMRSEGVPSEMEARIRGKDGEYRWFLIRDNPLRDEQGRVLRWYGTRTDIEDRKRAEEKLQQSEGELRQIVDVVPQHIFVLEPDGEFLYVNRRDLEYSGLTLHDVLAADYLDRIWQPDDWERLRYDREHAIAQGIPWEAEGRLLGKDGQFRCFLIRLNPLRDEQGRIIRWYGTRTDIEDRKQAEEELRQAQAKLAHVTRVVTMGELVASIAHEVNQPISGIVSNGSACLRWLAGDPPTLKRPGITPVASFAMGSGRVTSSLGFGLWPRKPSRQKFGRT